ncbi:MAG: AMP-binding protein [Duncaniella sp.]|nr:AMP-binding protein [Duncaniella sp.]
MELILTERCGQFLKEWRDTKPYITAHTSGSTGAPKEIKLLKSDMRASARATNEFFGITHDSTLLLPLSADYIAGKMQVVRALEAGCSLIAEEPSSTPFSHFEGHATMMPVVPSQLEGWLASGRTRMVDNLLIGGSPLSPDMERRLIDARVKAFVSYGMTETCSHVALRRVGDDFYTGLTGFAFSADERGCLVIDTTTLSFGRLVTNDVVALRDAMSFKWLGRADNVINSGGIKIHPEEIEKVIAEIVPSAVEFYVSSRQSAKWGREAVVVTTADEQTFPDAVLDFLAQRMGRRLIKDVIRVARIEKTASGKLKRERLD